MPINAALSQEALDAIESSVTDSDINKEIERRFLSRAPLKKIFDDRGGVPDSLTQAVRSNLIAKKVEQALLENN